MQSELSIYLPFVTSGISLLTALAVAFVGVSNLRSIEASKIRTSYLNYAFQKLMDEYMKYNPLINLNEAENLPYVRVYEKKFHECRALIIKISPLIDEYKLEELHKIEIKQVSIIKNQHNLSIAGHKPVKIDADEYAALLTEYIDLGHSIIKSQISMLRNQLEKAQ